MIGIYKTKAVKIKAVQWDGSDESFKKIKGWANEGDIERSGIVATLQVNTKQGEVNAKKTDYIIKLDDGEVYPCNEETFKKKYELVEFTDSFLP